MYSCGHEMVERPLISTRLYYYFMSTIILFCVFEVYTEGQILQKQACNIIYLITLKSAIQGTPSYSTQFSRKSTAQSNFEQFISIHLETPNPIPFCFYTFATTTNFLRNSLYS